MSDVAVFASTVCDWVLSKLERPCGCHLGGEWDHLDLSLNSLQETKGRHTLEKLRKYSYILPQSKIMLPFAVYGKTNKSHYYHAKF